MCNVHFMRAVLKNIPKKDKKEVAYMLKDALEDEAKMQKLAVVLDDKGYRKSADTIDSFPIRSLELQIVSKTTLETDPNH